jgi:RNA polymerase Rpb2, domain 4
MWSVRIMKLLSALTTLNARTELLLSNSSVRQLRRGGRIGEFVSVYLNPEQKAVYIASDGGRVCRPLLVLELGASRGSGREEFCCTLQH